MDSEITTTTITKKKKKKNGKKRDEGGSGNMYTYGCTKGIKKQRGKQNEGDREK